MRTKLCLAVMTPGEVTPPSKADHVPSKNDPFLGGQLVLNIVGLQIVVRPRKNVVHDELNIFQND